MTTEEAINLDFSDPEWRIEPGLFVAAITAAGSAPVRIDLSELSRSSTLVIQALVSTKTTFESRDQPVEFFGATQDLDDRLATLGLSEIFSEQQV